MSLDVYLSVKDAETPASSGIFIRENGANREISREEWDERHPGREPVVAVADEDETYEVFTANITHNLGRMAAGAGLYEILWRPEELGATHAHHLIDRLETGLYLLKNESDLFRELNPENGWGDYDGLVEFVGAYLAACRKWPHAEVRACR